MASEIKVDTVSEKTSANGVTIDGVALKDGAVTATGVVTGTAFTAGSAVLAEAELELLDGLTAGTAIASKVVTTDASIDTTGQRNLTISGELDAATLDISGAIDIAGNSQFSGTVTVGVDDTGKDVKLFGATSGSHLLWDESADDLNLIASGLGVTTAKDLGVGIHVRTADSGADVHAGADELVLENNGNCGLSILSSTDGNGKIGFGDSGDNDIGAIIYDHAGNSLRFKAGAVDELLYVYSDSVVVNEGSADIDFRVETNGATHALFIDGGANKIGINESAHNATRGLAINQAADDEAILLFYSSDVAHGITDIAETDTFGGIHKKSGTAGGIIIKGTSEGAIASTLQGIVTTANTTKGTGGDAPVQLDANLKSGTGVAAVGSNGNLLIVTNAGNAKFIVDAEGDIHYDGSDAGAYDTYDDAQLVRAFDLSHGKGVIDSKFDKFVSYNHEKLAEMKLVGREDDGTPNHFINTTGMQRLHNGAIWQQYEKHNQLLEAVYELAEKAVGKKEADAILDKHEVKRLN
mgnify:CR=1 FL=1